MAKVKADSLFFWGAGPKKQKSSDDIGWLGNFHKLTNTFVAQKFEFTDISSQVGCRWTRVSCPPWGTGTNAVLEVARLTELMCILDAIGPKVCCERLQFFEGFCVLLFVIMKSDWPGWLVVVKGIQYMMKLYSINLSMEIAKFQSTGCQITNEAPESTLYRYFSSITYVFLNDFSKEMARLPQLKEAKRVTHLRLPSKESHVVWAFPRGLR